MKISICNIVKCYFFRINLKNCKASTFEISFASVSHTILDIVFEDGTTKIRSIVMGVNDAIIKINVGNGITDITNLQKTSNTRVSILHSPSSSPSTIFIAGFLNFIS